MNFKFIFIISFFNIFTLNSQTNLVPNPGFELVYDDAFCYEQAGESPEEIAKHWNQIENWTYPRYSSTCATPLGLTWANVPSADVVCRRNRNPSMIFAGDNSLFTNADNRYREYATVKLKEKLKQNTYYYFEFYYQVGTGVPIGKKISAKYLGIKFFEERPEQCYNRVLNTGGYINYNKYNQAYLYEDVLVSPFQWRRARGYYNTGFAPNLEWLVIGSWPSLNDNELADGNFYFDNIKIIEIGKTLCPKKWLFDNIIFNQGTEIYQASDTIKIGNGADPSLADNEHGDVIVKAGSKLVLRAMHIIEMDSGFVVEQGAEYVAERDFSCEEKPCTKPKFVDKDIFVCKSREELNVITNLEDIKETWSYKWSNSEQISDPKILNPILYLPSGQGSFKLNLEITTICEKFNKEFTIHYNNNELNYEIHDIVKTQKDLSFKISYTNWCDITINVPGISYSKTFSLKDIDNTFYWEFPKDYLGNNVCDFKDYNVEIKVKSLCTEYQNTENILWNNRKADKINHEYHTYSLITFGNDENRKLWVVGTGMDYFTYELRDRGSQVYYVENVPITSTKMVIFDWEKDKTNRIKGESQYAYILTVKNCSGEQARYNGWVRIYGNTPGNPDELDSLENNYETPIFYEDIEISDTQLKNNAFVKDEYSNATITIFPNPVISNLTIKSNADTKGTIYIYDNIGKLLFSSEFAGTEKEINMDNFNKGIYHLNFINFKGVEQRFKFIKQ